MIREKGECGFAAGRRGDAASPPGEGETRLRRREKGRRGFAAGRRGDAASPQGERENGRGGEGQREVSQLRTPNSQPRRASADRSGFAAGRTGDRERGRGHPNSTVGGSRHPASARSGDIPRRSRRQAASHPPSVRQRRPPSSATADILPTPDSQLPTSARQRRQMRLRRRENGRTGEGERASQLHGRGQPTSSQLRTPNSQPRRASADIPPPAAWSATVEAGGDTS